MWEREKRFRTTLDAAPVILSIAVVDKRQIFYNKRWLDFAG